MRNTPFPVIGCTATLLAAGPALAAPDCLIHRFSGEGGLPSSVTVTV